mgnify:FL=1
MASAEIQVRVMDTDVMKATVGALKSAIQWLEWIKDLPDDAHYGAAQEHADDALGEIADAMGYERG